MSEEGAEPSGADVSWPKKGLKALALLTGTVILVGAHISAAGNPDLAGPLLVLDHLFNLALVTILLGLCLGVGLVLLARLSPRTEPPLDRCVFGVGLGAGVVSTLILLLGLAGLLYPWLLGAMLLGLAWFARGQLATLPNLSRAAVRQLAGSGGHTGLRAAAVGLTILAVTFLVAISLTPPVDWDSLLLHLRVPSQFLLEHRIHVPQDNLPSGFAAMAHMLYVPLLAAGSESGPAILSAALALMLSFTVVALCQRFFDDGIAYLSIIGLWGCSLVLMVAVTPRVDVTLAFYALLTHYALLKALPTGDSDSDGVDEERWRGSFLVAAIAAALMVSVKYHGFVYAVALAPLVLVASGGSTADAGVRTRRIVVFVAITAAVALPWIAKNLALFDAPFFPMFASPRLPPWLATLYGSPDFPFAGRPAFSGLVWELSEPFNLRDFFLAPHRLTIENEAVFYFSTPLLALLPLSALYLRHRIIAWLLLPAVAYAGIVLMYSSRTNLRYLIPAIVVLTIVSAAASSMALHRLFPDKRARHLMLGMLLVPLSFLPTGFTLYVWASRSAAVTHLVGVTSPHEFGLTRPFENLLLEVARDVGEILPDGSRLLLLFEPRGYHFGPDAWQDSQMSHWPLISLAPADSGCLEESGLTHVLLNMNPLVYRLDNSVDPSVFEWQTFPDFADSCLRALYSNRGYTLFEIRPAGR